MDSTRRVIRVAWVCSVALLVGIGGVVLSARGASSAVAESSPKEESHVSPGKSGAELWAQNCARCHTMRSPSEYSAREWDVIVHDMRVRANLTAKEYEAIREFLASGN